MGLDVSEQTLRRWARRLHDEPLQGIGAVRIRLAAARRGSSEELPGAVDDAIDQLACEIGALRSLIAELRPAALDELGLLAALRGLADQHAEAGLEVDLDLSLGGIDAAARELHPEVESTIFRVVQEALANVAGHAGAGRAQVRLRPAVGGISLSIADDGVGFEADLPGDGGGLDRLKERIELLGGTLRVSSEPGAGATLRARLPESVQASGPQAQPSWPSISPRSSA